MAHFSFPATRLAMKNMAKESSLAYQIKQFSLGKESILLKNYLDLISFYRIACQVEKYSDHTISSYDTCLKQFALYAAINNYPAPQQLTPHHIRLYLLHLQDRLKDSSVNRHYRCLQTFFKWLIAEKVTENYPLTNINPPKFAKRQPTIFSPEEIRNIALLLSGKLFKDIRNRAIVFMYLDTGLRLEEMTNIQIADIDWKRFIIRVVGKGDKERTVGIQKTTQKALLTYMVARRDVKLPCLWLTESKTPLSYHGVKDMIFDLLRCAGITGHGASHKFRHTFAVNALKNGCDLYTLQRWLGHTNPKTTEIYLGAVSTDDMIIKHQSFSPVEKMKL